MGKLRHWKQHYSADAKFVLRKRLLFAGKQMERGDVLTEEMKAVLGRGRLENWWEANIIEIMDGTEFRSPEPEPVEETEETELQEEVDDTPEDVENEGDTPEPGEMLHRGVGWYDVNVDGVITRVRGEENAKALLDG